MRKTALDTVHALARRDPRVLFLGSDLGAGTLDAMRRERPGQFFMEGVSEAALIGMAAGLALDGFVPYLNTIATFLTRRCYEQVAIDLCLHNLPVRLIGSGGGLVYAPLGPTHMAVEDIAILRALPNMAVVAPADAEEMARCIEASLDWPGPLYIRVAKGGDPIVTRPEPAFRIGRAFALRPPGRVGAVTTGIMAGPALKAAELLAAEGIAMGVLHMPTVKPLDAAALLELAGTVELIVTIEEHGRIGGLGSAVLELLSDSGAAARVLRCGLPDRFPDDYGSQEHLLAEAGLTAPALAAAIRAALDGGGRR